MIDILHSTGVFFALLVVIFAFGTLIMHKTPNPSFSLCMLVGFISLFALSELLVLPFTLLKQSLTITSYIWIGVILPVTVFSLVWNRKICYQTLKRIPMFFRKLPALGYVAVALFALVILIVQNTWVVHSDDAYYTGLISSAMYTDTMHQHNPYTGAELPHIEMRYALSSYHMVSAIICNLTMLHPLLLTRLLMPTLILLLVFLLFYKIGQELFKSKSTHTFLFLIFYTVILLFGHFSAYNPFPFLLTRTAQGKSILAGFLLPLLFLLCLYLYKNPYSKRLWGYMFILALAGVSFSITSAFLLPVAMGVFFIPLAVVKKSATLVLNFLLCSLPCVIFAGIFYLHSQNILTIPI